MFICVKILFHPVLHMLPMNINEFFFSPDMIWPSPAVLGGYANANVHSLVNINVSPFGTPTMIGGGWGRGGLGVLFVHGGCLV